MELQSNSPEMMVYQALRAATDPNHVIVQKGQGQLAEWEGQPGFFPTLARMCISNGQQQVEANVRWMAAVYLKNGINKFWRRTTRSELPAEEKQQIRQVLLTQFASEPVPQIALQVAILIARIARIDCPRDWPELVPELLKRLQISAAAESEGRGTTQEQYRVLLVLHHVVKALASRRQMADKRVFEEFANNIFTYMQELWHTLTRQFFHQLKSAPGSAMSTLERALLSMRILRKLTIYGFSKPYKSQACMQFIEQLFTCLKQCLECRYELQRIGAEQPIIALLEKFILKQMKTLNEFQESHSTSFVRFLPAALEFSFNHVFHEGTRLVFTDNIMNFRNFAIHCMNLMKGILMCTVYTRLASPADDPETITPIALADFFTNERLCYISEKIITHYFLLTQVELDLWMEDPESFGHDDGGESWKYELRPCVETLFLTCFSQYQTQMTTEVAKYIHKAQQIQLTANSDLKDILLKDAIYNAAGLASFHFFHDIDFDVWFKDQLLAELRIDTNNFRILRRRIIWLLGKWASVKFSRELRPLAYETCLHLLRSSEDMSIRIAASRTLYGLIGDYEFTPVPFLPYLPPVFDALFILLREAKECDTKIKVLNIMSLIVENMSDNIEPYADKLIAYLPLLWKESDEYNMLRCTIISTLQQIVKAIRDIPETLKPFLYSVIMLSTDLQEPSHIYLIEEGLTLWLAVVENSTSISPPLIAMCKNLLPIIEMSSENLRIVLMIIQAYILLDSHAFLDLYGPQFVAFCTRMFDDIRPDGIALMLKVYESILKDDPTYGLELLRPSLPYIFKQVYLDKEFPMLMSMYFMMIARVLIINQTVFQTIVQELQVPNALETILDTWITKMPIVQEVEKRKLFSLAFGSIFANNAMFLERFSGIIQNITETLQELMREDDESPMAATENAEQNSNSAAAKGTPKKYCDSLVFLDEHDLDTSSYSIMEDFDYKTYHYSRCRQLSLKDPVHKTGLADYIEWQLHSLRMQMGEAAYHQLLETVDPTVLTNMSQYVKLNMKLQPN